MSDTPMTRFGLVVSGMAVACEDDVAGNRMIMAEVSPGRTFGEAHEFMRTENPPVYIIAAEDTDVVWMTSQGLFGGSRDPFTLEIQRRFVRMLASRTLSMNDRIQVLSKLRLRDKLVTYFSQLSSAAGSADVTLPLSRGDLAVYVGTNRSALSRELSLMEKEGLIVLNGKKLTILNSCRRNTEEHE